MATPREVALEHYRQRQLFVAATTEVADQLWAEVNPNNIADSWATRVPEMTAVISGAQLGAARQADSYLDDVLESQDLDDASVGSVDPTGFAGQASDARGLLGLLTNPVVVTLLTIQDGFDVATALSRGRNNLEMLVATQVADAGRLADQVALTARPAATGYVRVAVGNSCARCLLLAGETYQWNTGFQRHPKCDCIHLPAGSRNARLARSPRQIYDRMTVAERSRAGFSKADQKAISDGAELGQVVNAKRGLYTAGGQRFTTEGTTKRGLFRRFEVDPETGALKARPKASTQPRLSVDEIYRVAGGDRDEAIRLLGENAYLRIGEVHLPRREVITLAEAAPARAARAGGSALPTVRPVLEAARTTGAVETAFKAEFERITGRKPRLVTMPRSAATAREVAEGLLRGLERFPDADLREVRLFFKGHDNAYAIADSSRWSIEFSDDWTNPAMREQSLASLTAGVVGWRHGVQEYGVGIFKVSSFHPRGTGNWTAIAIHEFGHNLDIATLGTAIRADLDDLIARRTAAAMRIPRPHPETPITGPDDLISREISGYATKNRHELVAEAFADVMMNGPAASQLSREIFDLLEAEYRKGGRRVGVSVISASEPAPNLARLKVAELRALAKERGVAVPARALKADLVRLLSEPPTSRAVAAPPGRVADPNAAGRAAGRAVPAGGGVPRGLDSPAAPLADIDRAREAIDNIGGRVSAFDRSGATRSAFLSDFRDKYPSTFARLVQEQKAVASFVRWADHHGLSGSAAEIRAAMEREMRDQLAQAHVVVRYKTLESLRGILKSGRLKSQFETGRSTAMLDLKKRAELERAAWGYTEDMPPQMRPIYGYFSPGDAREAAWRQYFEAQPPMARAWHTGVHQYGGIRVVLKDDVRHRTSVTVGDSLLNERLPSPADSPDWRSFQYGDDGPPPGSDWWSPEFQWKVDYVESQIHGGVVLDDIAEIVLDKTPPRDVIDLLDRQGIPWRLDGQPRNQSDSVGSAAKRAAARARQAEIDVATTRADVLAEVDELLARNATPQALAEVIDRAKSLTAADITALRRATANPAKAQAVLDRISKKYELTGVTRAGDITTMREGFEVVGGRELPEGAQVRIVRRGTEAVRNGERIVLSRPLVREVTEAELATIRQAAIDEARAFLAATPKPTAAQLRKAGVTKVGTASKTKTVAFDPQVHEVGGVAPTTGAKVRVVEPGYTTQYRGETVVLRKPVVEVVADPASAAAEYAVRQRQVVDALSNPGLTARPLGNGAQARTTLETTPDGRQVVRKYFEHGSAREAAHMTTAEELGSRVMEAFGIRAPAVVRVGDRAVAMEFIDGELGDSIVGYGNSVAQSILDTDDARLIGLADYLTYNVDRNTGNWIRLADGRIAALDHASMFLDPLDAAVGPGVPWGLWGDFSGYLKAGDDAAGNPILRDTVDVSRADLALIRKRLAALRPEFVARGRLVWHTQTMRLLRELEGRAVGTRNMLAP